MIIRNISVMYTTFSIPGIIIYTGPVIIDIPVVIYFFVTISIT